MSLTIIEKAYNLRNKPQNIPKLCTVFCFYGIWDETVYSLNFLLGTLSFCYLILTFFVFIIVTSFKATIINLPLY